MSGQTDPLPESSPAPQGIERRVATRHAVALTTSCRLLASAPGRHVSIRVRNISVTGISLVVSHCVDPDTVLTIQLRSLARNFNRTLPVRVVYCIEHPSGDWLIGGSFAQALQDDELRIFIGSSSGAQ